MKMMFRKISGYVGSLTVLLVVGVAAAGVDRFVSKDHPGGDGDYLTWETAAPDIQSAIRFGLPMGCTIPGDGYSVRRLPRIGC